MITSGYKIFGQGMNGNEIRLHLSALLDHFYVRPLAARERFSGHPRDAEHRSDDRRLPLDLGGRLAAPHPPLALARPLRRRVRPARRPPRLLHGRAAQDLLEGESALIPHLLSLTPAPIFLV